MEGRIAKYRKFLDNPISHNLELSGLRDHILLRANHSVSSFYLGQTKITVQPGEFVWSQKKMSDRFGISLNKTHRYLKILEKENFIETKGHSKYTVFKVLNRETYQGDRKQIENKQKANRMPVETYKNDNNEENEKKDIILLNNIEDKSSNKSNPDINNLISDIKNLCNQMGVSYDKQKERQFGKHICTAKEYGAFCEKIGQTRSEFALNVMKASIKINYWKGVCAGPMKIYQNYAEVYNKTKLLNKKEEGEEYVLPGID